MAAKPRLVVGITGATGTIYGVRLLEVLSAAGVETHLIMTKSSRKVVELETGFTVAEIEGLAGHVHDNHDIGACIASGSFHTIGMVVAPCSIKSLSAIANSYNENLLVRAADVTLKERRKLILVTRETPLHLGHLRLMTQVTETGAVVLPPMPSFYHCPQTIDDIVNQTVGKILDQCGLDHDLFRRWEGSEARRRALAQNEALNTSFDTGSRLCL
jgi:flavin prenyltransferase